VAVSPLFLPAYWTLLKQQHQLLAPVLVTASAEQRSFARVALERGAFDLIAKPIVPSEAAYTVRLALWQHQLLRLLAAKEAGNRTVPPTSGAFPQGEKMEGHFTQHFDAFTRTLLAVQTSLRALAHIEDEQALFDMAALMEHRARQWALDRLLTLGNDV